MPTDYLLWLFPFIFIIHDLEEILIAPGWLRRNRKALLSRFPRAARLIQGLSSASKLSFALAVAIMFVPVLTSTVLAVTFKLYDLWAGAVTVFMLHFGLHISQAIALRGYVPALATSIPGILACGYLLNSATSRGLLDPANTFVWTLISLFVAVGALALGHVLRRLVERGSPIDIIERH